MSLLESLFLSKARAKIFETLFYQEVRELYLRELERVTGVGFKALHDDIHRMVKMDLVLKRRDGNRTYFSANSDHPLYGDFRSIVDKIYGPIARLTQAFEPVETVDIAFIFGSYARGDTHAESDIDLFVIGSIKDRDLSSIVSDIQSKSSYLINDHIYSERSFRNEVVDREHFITSLKDTEKVFVKGCQDDFRKLYRT